MERNLFEGICGKMPNQHERVEAFTGTTEFVKLSDGQLDDIKGMHEVSCVLLAVPDDFR